MISLRIFGASTAYNRLVVKNGRRHLIQNRGDYSLSTRKYRKPNNKKNRKEEKHSPWTKLELKYP